VPAIWRRWHWIRSMRADRGSGRDHPNQMMRGIPIQPGSRELADGTKNGRT
jgi:hypothetical protein